MAKTVKRLFYEFEPEHYDLALVPDREAQHFTGSVTIRGKKTGRPSQRLTLHQKGLKVTAAQLIRHDKNGEVPFAVDRINHQRSSDEVRLHSSVMLYPGNYTLRLEFEGKITSQMNGMYPCKFEHNGQEKQLIATQFESHHAREVFPGIDEPEAKATFQLTLTTPKDEVVLSNTPIETQRTNNKKTKTTFQVTPRMSTYLLAFVYGELQAVSGKSKNGIEVKSWATVAQPLKHLQYANDEAIALLDFFEDYFGMAFPLPKLDQVALPDFDSMAMENWGLITFREVGLLADPTNRSISAERMITMVIAHELSHQWFGNLVTMQWWDDLWLNESFASIMESLAPDKLHPDWQEWEDFTSGRVIGCANRDVYKDVQPVGVQVKHPDEIMTLFDPNIVYAKGARILKMLFDFIGEEAFRGGLSAYFKKFAYKNTSRSDLWAALSQSSGMDIDALMTPWIEQTGTPELSIRKQGERLQLSQQRFLLDGDDTQSLWPIPLLSTTKVEPTILEKRQGEVVLDSQTMPIFNPTGSGHYLVHYQDEALRQNVQQKFLDGTLESTGRIITINDMLLQTQRGDFPLTDALDLVHQCRQEDRDAVWSVFARVFHAAGQLTEGDTSAETQLKAVKRKLSADWYKKLGWDDAAGDDPNTKHLRTTALALSIAGEDPEAIAEGLRRMKKAGDVEGLDAEQRALIAGVAIRFGDKHYIKDFLREHQTSANPDVQSAIAAALCSTRDPKVAQQIVDWGMYDDKIIRAQDIDHWFAYLMRNHYTREVAWKWLNDRWPYLLSQFGEGKKMEYFIWYASRPIASLDWQKRYKAFFEPKAEDVSMKRNILISLAEIQARLDWRKRDEAKIKVWLKGQSKS